MATLAIPINVFSMLGLPKDQCHNLVYLRVNRLYLVLGGSHYEHVFLFFDSGWSLSLSSDEPHSKLTLSLFEIGQQAGSFLVVGLWSWEFVPYDIGQ